MSLILTTILTIAATCVSAWLDHKGRVANANEINEIQNYIRRRIGKDL